MSTIVQMAARMLVVAGYHAGIVPAFDRDLVEANGCGRRALPAPR